MVVKGRHINNQAFKGEKIDIYYKDATPRQVMAIQLYDQFGDPTTKYTTSAYDQNPTTYQKQGVGPGFGEFIVALGPILAAIGGYLTYVYAEAERVRVIKSGGLESSPTLL